MMKKTFFCAILLVSLLLPALAQDTSTPKRALTPEELRTLLPELNQPSMQPSPGTQNSPPARGQSKTLTPEQLRSLLPKQLPEGPLTFPQPTAPAAPYTDQNPGGTWYNGTMNRNNQAPYYNYGQNRATYLPQYGPQLNDRYRQTGPTNDYSRNPYLNGPYINGPLIHGPFLNLPGSNNQTMYNSNCPNCGAPLNTNGGGYNGSYPNYGDYRPQNSGTYPNYGDYRYRGNPYNR